MRVLICIFSVLLCAISLTKCVEHHIDQRILEDQLDSSNSSLEIQDELDLHNYFTSINSSEKALQTVNSTLLLRDNNGGEEDSLKVSGLNDTSNGEPITNQTQVIDDLIIKNDDTPIDTEVNDLLHNTEIDFDQYLSNVQHPLEPEITIQFPDKIDKQVELIEDGENTEDELRRHREEETSDDKITHKPLAVVLISMFVAMSILCYAALLIWRNYLENRYGSRTLLVEAEEFPEYNNNPNDMKHFSI